MPTTFKFTVIAVVALASSILTSAPASAGLGDLAPCPWAGRLKNVPMSQARCEAYKSLAIKRASHTRYKPGVQTQPTGVRRGPLGKAVGAYQPGTGTSVALKRR
jgi:hypothetical protein